MPTDPAPDLRGTPLRPSELVAVQPGAIVSRVLVKRPTGNVTLFAFDAGQELSEHTAPFDAVLHVLGGRAAVTVGPAAHRMAAGELIVLPANVPHAVRADDGPFTMMLTMIRG